jgi:hypothetical protein
MYKGNDLSDEKNYFIKVVTDHFTLRKLLDQANVFSLSTLSVKFIQVRIR